MVLHYNAADLSYKATSGQFKGLDALGMARKENRTAVAAFLEEHLGSLPGYAGGRASVLRRWSARLSAGTVRGRISE